jgi:DNA polymerase
MLATVGQRIPVMNGFATILAEGDFETFSEAGFRWDDGTQKWAGLPLAGKTKRGLPVVGVYNYVLHPSFDIIQLAYNLKDGEGARIWRPGMPNPDPLLNWVQRYKHRVWEFTEKDWTVEEDVTGVLEAWNVFFEATVWNLYCVPKLGWPPLYLEQLRCCMAKAALAGYPRALDNAGPVLRLTQQKDKEGSHLINKLTRPRNPTKNNRLKRWTRETAPLDFAKFDAYNVQDIMAESEASTRLPDLPPRELAIWKVDQRINHRGMRLDLKVIDDCIAIIQQAEAKYWAELREITNGEVQTHNEVKPTVEWLKTQGVYLDGLDEDIVEEELEKNHTRAVRRVLQIRRTLSFGSVKKLYAMRMQACPDERLRDQYAYAAAHTQLWNGQNVQVANLVKGKFNKPEQIEFALAVLASRSLEYVEGVFSNGPPWDDKDNDPMEALEVITHCLRSVIIAADGTRLISSDYNAIQAVVTAALAGEKWVLDVFHNKGQIYLETASILTGTSVAEYIAYKDKTGKHHPDRQYYGKIPTLANGFGAWIKGWRKLDKEGILADWTDEQIKQLILKMRASTPATVELWGGQTRNKFKRDEAQCRYGLEGAAIEAVLNPGHCFTNRPGPLGIKFQVHNDVLYCQPPGGYAPLVYHEPRLEQAKKEWSRPWELELSYVGWNSNQTKGKGGWVRMPLYGGVLTQNGVANVARQPQANSLVRLECTRVYLPVMHTHDEIVTEVKDGQGNKAEYLSIVNKLDDWMIDDWGRPWPIRAPDADETHRYGKWE